ncbi:MAG: helix-turn-helix domain-containing protein [Crocosphaera sp.]
MRKTYQYKLKPTCRQRQEINRWLDMLRCQYVGLESLVFRAIA